jgi:probable rRNA maturation factor
MHRSKLQNRDFERVGPSIVILNRQRAWAVDLPFLRRAAAVALDLCVSQRGGGSELLTNLDEIVITCVSDKRIARVHREFMSIAGATDVITFQHGDILISADTAAREGHEHGHSLDEELLLYVVHGLLHLNGHDDLEEGNRSVMHLVQDKIWRAVLDCVG